MDNNNNIETPHKDLKSPIIKDSTNSLINELVGHHKSSKRVSTQERKQGRRNTRASNQFDSIINVVSRELELDEDMIQLIKIVNARKHTEKEIAILIDYFNTVKIKNILQDNIDKSHLPFDTLFNFYIQSIRILNYSKGEVIYYEGSKDEREYLLLKGNIILHQLNYQEIEFTFEEYLRYLKKLYDEQGNYFLIEKMIKSNESIYPIYNFLDLQNIDEILFNIKLTWLAYERDTEKIRSYILDNKKKLEDYGYEQLIINEIDIDTYYMQLKDKLTDSENNYFNFFKRENENLKNKITTISFKPIIQLKENEFFGLLTYNKNTNTCESNGISKKESAIADGTSIVFEINKKYYYNLYINEIRNKKEREIEFVHQNSIFRIMSKNNFASNYFHKLELVDFQKDDFIYQENDIVDYIYILKEGKLEIYLNNKSIMDIKNLINFVKGCDSRLETDQFDDTIEIANNIKYLLSYLYIKKNHNLFITLKDILGVLEYKYEIKFFYNVKVISDKAKLYRLSVEKLPKNNKEASLLIKAINIESFKKIKAILERLINLKNALIMKIDCEITKKKGEINSHMNIQMNNALLNNSNIIGKKLKNVSYNSSNVSSNLNIMSNINTSNMNKSDSKRNFYIPTNPTTKNEEEKKQTNIHSTGSLNYTKLKKNANINSNISSHISNNIISLYNSNITSTNKTKLSFNNQAKTSQNSELDYYYNKSNEYGNSNEQNQLKYVSYKIRGRNLIDSSYIHANDGAMSVNYNFACNYINKDSIEKKLILPKLFNMKNRNKGNLDRNKVNSNSISLNSKSYNKKKLSDSITRNQLNLGDYLQTDFNELNSNDNKNLNYLAVKKFYNHFNSCKKNKINKVKYCK